MSPSRFATHPPNCSIIAPVATAANNLAYFFTASLRSKPAHDAPANCLEKKRRRDIQQVYLNAARENPQNAARTNQDHAEKQTRLHHSRRPSGAPD